MPPQDAEKIYKRNREIGSSSPRDGP